MRSIREIPIEPALAPPHSAGMIIHSKLVGALIKGMRRVKSAWAASIAYSAGLAKQISIWCVTPDNAGKVLDMFAPIPSRSTNSG